MLPMGPIKVRDRHALRRHHEELDSLASDLVGFRAHGKEGVHEVV